MMPQKRRAFQNKTGTEPRHVPRQQQQQQQLKHHVVSLVRLPLLPFLSEGTQRA